MKLRGIADAAFTTERLIERRILSVGRWGASALLTAGLLALAQPPYDFAPLVGIALVPWLVAVATARHWPAALVGSLVVGTAVAWASAPWGPRAIESLGATTGQATLGFFVGTLWVRGVPFAVVGGLAYATRPQGPWTRIALTALGFLAVDWVHSTSSAGVPWALLGHSQAGALGVAQLAAIGGVPLLSGLLAAINQVVAIAWETRASRESLRALAALAAAWLVMALAGLPLARVLRSTVDPTDGVTLLLVQPHVPRGERWAENLQAKHLAKIALQTQRGLSEPGPKPDAVLWPENLLTAPIDREPELAERLQATVDRLGVPVILGAVQSAGGAEPDLYRSSVLWLEPDRGTVTAIDKTQAFPLLEASVSSPGARLLARAFGAAGRGKKVEEAAQAGPLRGSFTVTAVLCYEALFPGIVADRRAPESVALVNLADDGWIGGAAATRQLAAFASFRAIEQRLPLVRVAHGGLSVAFDPFGEPILELRENAWAHARIEVRPSPPPGLTERAALVALPLATGMGVWWLLSGCARGGAGAVGLGRPPIEGREPP
jgi:apolipoprotein N-acyltransferase